MKHAPVARVFGRELDGERLHAQGAVADGVREADGGVVDGEHGDAALEGYAAWIRHPSAVLCGQIAYVTGLTLTLVLAFALGAPGWFIGFAAIFVATLATTAAVLTSLRAFSR